jgi:hypothetical protein
MRVTKERNMILTEKQAYILKCLSEMPLEHSAHIAVDEMLRANDEDIKNQCDRCCFHDGCDTFQHVGFNYGYCHASSEVTI